MPSETLAIPTIHGNAHDDARTQTTMRVRKRNGSTEPVDVNKIVARGESLLPGAARRRRHAGGHQVRSAGSTMAPPRASWYQLSIQTAASLIVEEPQYSGWRPASSPPTSRRKSAVRRSTPSRNRWRSRIAWGSSMIAWPSWSRATRASSTTPSSAERDREFEYFGLRTVYDRYLLKHPTDAPGRRDAPALLPAHRLRAVARRCGGAGSISCSRRSSTCPARPRCSTRHAHEQLSSCFLLDSPDDSLENIYQRYTDVALLSKFSGGIGLAYHRVRARGSLIESTNGHSSGIVPWLKTLDGLGGGGEPGRQAQGGVLRVPGAVHADVEEFLELRDNTGDEARRTHNLNLANWVARSLHEARRGRSGLEPVRIPRPSRT
jgi:ribonucleoside-diphosphate reductase alpha chain